ncbi:MAG: hypothetical protein U0800_12570 [Isosphaeraceae bacterium]
MTTMISKSYTDSHFGASPKDVDKVEIFRDRVTGWQLDIAKEIIRQIDATGDGDVIHHAGYAVLSILTNYFEMIWQHIAGTSSNRRSGDFFAYGFKDVYKTTPLSHDDIKDIVYHRLRCGMYHDGYTRKGVTIKHNYPQDFEYDRANDELKVNPHTLVGTLETHFAAYIAKLQPGTNELRKFLAIFNQSMPTVPATPPPPTGIPPTPPAAPPSYPPPSQPSGTPPRSPLGGGASSGGSGGFFGGGGPPPSGTR